MSYIDPNADIEELRRLGEVKDSVVTPADDPLEGQEPFSLAPYRDLFFEGAEIAEALANEPKEIGETVWDFTGE